MTGITEPLTYGAGPDALAERGRFGINLGLGRVRAVLHELGDPQLALRGALVAGTNGKGSVLALAGSALRAAGLRVGETPKPHLVSYRERLVVDGRPSRPTRSPARRRRSCRGGPRPARLGDPTEFELLTATIFAGSPNRRSMSRSSRSASAAGWTPPTPGMGAWRSMTNVDLDHPDRLGDTVAARSPARRPRSSSAGLAVTGATGDALAVIQRRAARLDVPLTVVEPGRCSAWTVTASTSSCRLGATRVGLRGRHQAANVAVADALLDASTSPGSRPVARRAPARLRRRSLAGPARAARARRSRRPLDGAHNPAGAAALATALDDLGRTSPPGPSPCDGVDGGQGRGRRRRRPHRSPACAGAPSSRRR